MSPMTSGVRIIGMSAEAPAPSPLLLTIRTLDQPSLSNIGERLQLAIALGDINDFDGMGHRINPRICSRTRWHTHGKAIINHRRNRHKTCTDA